MKGKALRFKKDNDINTDYIISGRYKFKIQDPKELAKHVFEDLDPKFYSKIKKDDFVIAGENFGCGSSREQAPQAIMYAGIQAVIAKSFARIFYRNAFNIGLALIECDTDLISDGDTLDLDLNKSELTNGTKNKKIEIKPIPPLMSKLLKDGGVVKHFNKYGGFKI